MKSNGQQNYRPIGFQLYQLYNTPNWMEVQGKIMVIIRMRLLIFNNKLQKKLSMFCLIARYQKKKKKKNFTGIHDN